MKIVRDGTTRTTVYEFEQKELLDKLGIVMDMKEIDYIDLRPVVSGMNTKYKLSIGRTVK